MNETQPTGKLAEAMAKFQADLPTAKKDGKNPHFRSNYATLSSVWDAIREPLSKNGLSIVQLNLPSDPGTVTVKTVLMHTSGEQIWGTITLPTMKADPQGYGSALTYARRYALMGMTGVCGEDDDGEGAMDRNAIPKAPEAPRPGGNGQTGPTKGQAKGVREPSAPASENQIKAIHAILNGMGIRDDFGRHQKVSRILDPDGYEVRVTLSGLTKGEASKVIDALNSERDG